GRANPVAAAQHRPRRMVGLGGPGQVWLVVLFPGIALAWARHLVDHVMQPSMPFRRHLRAFRGPLIDDPAPLTAEPPAAPAGRLVALQPVIAVAIGIGADDLAAQPSQ